MAALRKRGSRNPVRPPALDVELCYHFFISHVWSTGQDQARAIKQSLLQALPGVHVFLDVDDLVDISLLEEEIEASSIIVVFLSAAYFGSRNCMRELDHAVLSKKQLILVRESTPRGAPCTSPSRRAFLFIRAHGSLFS